jgi:hypothetical protein
MEQQVSNARQVRAAKNQATMRAVNEQLEGVAEKLGAVSATPLFVCECANTNCVQRVPLSISEYEAVRAHPNRFVVLPGHVYPDVESVVGTTERFVLVSKLGEGATIATEGYERSAALIRRRAERNVPG